MRLFIAFETGDAIRRELTRLQRALKKVSNNRISFVSEEHLHVTLRFLGDIEEAKLEALKEAVSVMASNMKPFTLRLDCVSCNPAHGPLRLVWVVPAEEGEGGLVQKNFEACNRALEGLVEFPEKENRPYLAHITLARINRDNREQKAIREAVAKLEVEPLYLQVDSITLFNSTLTHQGARHEALYRCKLGKGQVL